MELDPQGYIRPKPTAQNTEVTNDEQKRNIFENSCPGFLVRGPDSRSMYQEPFGNYLSAWKGYAVDPKIRFEGSSGGVLTALSSWLLDSGEVAEVIASASDRDSPARTLPVTIKGSDEVGAISGSRYAPVANASLLNLGTTNQALVGKPCEVSATNSLYKSLGKDLPLTLTFFCAGTPSQLATEKLVARLGQNLENLKDLRYRGLGWPGKFRVTDNDGQVSEISYSDSWGSVLGKNLQWRCKICPDGCGQLADVSVGDLWESDSNGFPLFEDGEGMSVILARTIRGKQLIERAERQGIIVLMEVDLAIAAKVQSYQIQRRKTLAGRLMGLKLLGAITPTYKEFGLVKLLARHPFSNLRAIFGVIRRYLRNPRNN
jgi:coenzyme F420 hydrogenase subunit beta